MGYKKLLQKPMDHITFQYDAVLSDVHLRVPNLRHLMTRLNSVGQPVFMSRFRLLSNLEGTDQETGLEELRDAEEDGDKIVDPVLDEDGDFDVTHRLRTNSDRDIICPVILQQSDAGPGQYDDDDTRATDVIWIEHTMATPLVDVGKQVWRGAFLLADFILSGSAMFTGATVLELGGGAGLTSIVLATKAKTVYCTDVGEDLLSMCRRNVMLNEHLTVGEVKVRHLNWLEQNLRTDAELDFSWTQEEVTDLYNKTSIIIAADVCYDDELTDGLFRTVVRLCSRFAGGCIIFFSIERRINFSLRHLSESCEAYDHFRNCTSRLQALRDEPCVFRVQQLPADFPQTLLYDRVEQLELWKITAIPSSPPVPNTPPAPHEQPPVLK